MTWSTAPASRSSPIAARWFVDRGVVVKGHPLAWHTVSAPWLREPAPLIRTAFDEARAANPRATLLNDSDMSTGCECLIEGMLQAGVRLDALGLQSPHAPGLLGEWWMRPTPLRTDEQGRVHVRGWRGAYQPRAGDVTACFELAKGHDALEVHLGRPSC